MSAQCTAVADFSGKRCKTLGADADGLCFRHRGESPGPVAAPHLDEIVRARVAREVERAAAEEQYRAVAAANNKTEGAHGPIRISVSKLDSMTREGL